MTTELRMTNGDTYCILKSLGDGLLKLEIGYEADQDLVFTYITSSTDKIQNDIVGWVGVHNQELTECLQTM